MQKTTNLIPNALPVVRLFFPLVQSSSGRECAHWLFARRLHVIAQAVLQDSALQKQALKLEAYTSACTALLDLNTRLAASPTFLKPAQREDWPLVVHGLCCLMPIVESLLAPVPLPAASPSRLRRAVPARAEAQAVAALPESELTLFR